MKLVRAGGVVGAYGAGAVDVPERVVACALGAVALKREVDASIADI
jgi:hypothetical protein